MRIWRINGGNKLRGSLKIQGSKNASLPIIAASVLTGCDTELLNCPNISDIDASVSILRHLGCKVNRQDDVLSIDSRGVHCCDIPRELMEEMRSSVIFLGSVLARCSEARVYLPGGCELGSRPIDIHLEALRALGAEFETDGEMICCYAPKLTGTDMTLRFPSVGATENVMLAACGAEGVTIIRNAAREPEIVDLQTFLQKLGADISGAGTSTIIIRSFKPRKAAGHRIMSDRIAAATYMCACASAGGKITLNDANPGHIAPVTEALSAMGCTIERARGDLTISSEGLLKASPTVVTGPYPGFPTDAQPLLMAACLKANGRSVFIENMFENRYRQAAQLKKLGADIELYDRTAVINGVSKLRGAKMVATDLRGGAAAAVSALGAEGETVIFDSGHIERGYADFDKDLRSIGGDITKETVLE